MIKRLTLIAVTLLLAASAHAQKNKLNLYIWSEYMDPKIIEQFSKENDCKVTIDLFEDLESMMAKLQAGGTSLYDVVWPSDYIVQPLIKNGLLAPLRKDNIPNLKNIDPKFMNREYDPGNVYTTPYLWGTVGIYVRKKPGETIDETWGLLFDPKKSIGSFLLMDDARAMIGAALKYKGYSLNSVDKKQLKEARDVMIEAKKRSIGFDGGVGIKNKVLAKVCRLGVVYNGDAVRGMKDDSETYYFIPREGTEIWVDNMAVPAKAPNRDMAEKFINYILDAKIGAQLANFIQYPTPNAAARPLISEADLKNVAIYPTEEQMKTLEFVKDLGSKTGWYDELWTGVKSK
jgi:spermidine/putrescine transport system substrate-binding protein